MRMPLFSCLLVALALAPASLQAKDYTLEFTSDGNHTFTITRYAETGFARNTDKLKERALADAQAYCDEHHLKLKVLSTTAHRPFIPTTGFAYAKIVFQALEPGDPALTAPAAAPAPAPSSAQSPTDAIYSDLMKLEDLRRRGILTDAEFQTLKQRLIDRTKSG